MAHQYEGTAVGNLTRAAAASFRKTQHRTSYQVFGFSLTNGQPASTCLDCHFTKYPRFVAKFGNRLRTTSRRRVAAGVE